jgi:hypothetical protein
MRELFFETASVEEKDEIAMKKNGDGIGDLSRGYQRVDGGKKGSHEVSDTPNKSDTSVLIPSTGFRSFPPS